ncbi:phosphatidylinositol 3-kinase catalytic subunit type 3-like [Sycon ciliatum]|uniref:phosphatidylinositol 3-kinase catalytic subunit type 3-like n=1 Tax=Sycon ciliatum TaxID=27933 RepID=UPI0020AAF86B|eukprot:scpid23955/ scgid19548/ Phosphatidylinositol 3-kinase catalytic subunit type 3; Phosphoinositide-3-kinase class 3
MASASIHPSVSMESQEKYHFMYSHLVDDFVRVKIGSLQGKRREQSFTNLVGDDVLLFSRQNDNECPDYYVTVQIFADKRALALPTYTSYKAFSTRWNWNEWLTLPVRYSDLPPTSILAFTIWDTVGPSKVVAVGSTSISMFNKHRVLRKGTEDLIVWPDVAVTTDNVDKLSGSIKATKGKLAELTKLMKQHRKKQMPRVDWLDRLAFRELQQQIEKEKKDSKEMFLQIEFPIFDCQDPGFENLEYDVVYFEKGGDEVERTRIKADLVRVVDPDIDTENLVASKYHKLTHSVRYGALIKDLNPDPGTRDELRQIIKKPSCMKLTQTEQSLVWKYRYFLSTDSKALPKFLRYIDFSNTPEVNMALELMEEWDPVGVEGALDLLAAKFPNADIHRYAVSKLSLATDDELMLYLLQLVQALRFDKQDDLTAKSVIMTTYFANNNDSDEKMPNAPLPLESQGDTMIDPLGGLPISDKNSSQTTAMNNEFFDDPLGVHTMTKANKSGVGSKDTKDKHLSLASLLITRATNNFMLANFLFWYLCVEDQDCKSTANPFGPVLRSFSSIMQMEYPERFLLIRRQQQIITKLVSVNKQLVGRDSRPKKIERLRSLLTASHFESFEPFPIMLDPNVLVKSVVASEGHLFKSALMPSRITFLTTKDEHYVTIFKSGDDLRQDQLILQMITLMDKLLQRDMIDLKLTPYLCIATSPNQGFVQFIDSEPVAQVLATHSSIQAYFKSVAPCEVSASNPLGIQPDVMETYVRSCAGYCVITYLLGIGDRHLDNLLLTPSGHMFHIDFGFILGRDPKPFPPPMKLNKEMVEGMGGHGSAEYHRFRRHCYQAFLTLRREANLILNLWEVMTEANIADIAQEPDKTVQKVQDKFCLDMSEEEAVKFFQQLIDDSVSALFAVMVEQIHKWAQILRK